MPITVHRGSRIKRSFLHDQHHLPSRHDSSGAPIPSSRVTDRVMVAMLQAHRHRRVICDDRGSREDAIRHVRGTRGVLTSLSFFFFLVFEKRWVVRRKRSSKIFFSVEEEDEKNERERAKLALRTIVRKEKRSSRRSYFNNEGRPPLCTGSLFFFSLPAPT